MPVPGKYIYPVNLTAFQNRPLSVAITLSHLGLLYTPSLIFYTTEKTSDSTMSRRLSVVDLTSAHPISDRRSSTSLFRVQQPAVNRARSEATPRGIKRRRGDDGFWSPDPSGSSQEREQEEEEYVESVDLTEPEISLSKALAKQREDAIKAQQSTEEEKSGSVLSAYKCPVCLETPKDATSTACGKFGHKWQPMLLRH